MTFVTFVANQNLWWYIMAIYEIQHPTHVRPSQDLTSPLITKNWLFQNTDHLLVTCICDLI